MFVAVNAPELTTPNVETPVTPKVVPTVKPAPIDAPEVTTAEANVPTPVEVIVDTVV